MAEQTILIGKRIRQAREESGFTQSELAAKLPGKSDGTQISKWERGQHRPGDDTLESIARILRRPVAWFLVPEPDKSVTPDPFAASRREGTVEERLERIEQKLDALAGHVSPFTEEERAQIIRLLQELGQERAQQRSRRKRQNPPDEAEDAA